MTHRTHALLHLLRASGIDAVAAFDLRSENAGIEPGMLYACADGSIWHIPHRPAHRHRGYIATLVPHTPEANAYIGESSPCDLRLPPRGAAGYCSVRNAIAALTAGA